MCFRIILIATIYLLKASLIFAQENDSQTKNDSTSSLPAPLRSNKLPNIFAVKATLLPYTIGNDGGFATSVGVEDIFFKHHSIVIDGFLHLAEGSHDEVYDTAGVYHEVGMYHHSTEKAIFINYRYYFNYKNLREEQEVTVYISPYYRYGYIERFNDPRYKQEYDYQKERSHAEGFLLGIIGNIKGFKRGFIDFNIGAFKKQKEITTIYREDNVVKTRFEKQETVGCRIGIFFAILLY